MRIEIIKAAIIAVIAAFKIILLFLWGTKPSLKEVAFL